MSTLFEIQSAILTLSIPDRQKLFFLLAQSLRATPSQLPEPRKFSLDEVTEWIAIDEQDMRKIQGDS